MTDSIPRHIVLFPDGNRRWARERGLNPLEGHKAGYEKLVDFTHWCQDRGIKVVTAFGFSTENWSRTEEEVSYLMKLLEMGLRAHLKDFVSKDRGARVRVVGQKERLPQSLQDVIRDVEEQTKDQDGMFLNLAISYGGRWDITQAVQKIQRAGLEPGDITEESFGTYLSTTGLPDPDLIIRPGGEMRFSNFLLWQAAYAELYFLQKYWPDFTEQDLDEALAEYARRQRRFGQ